MDDRVKILRIVLCFLFLGFSASEFSDDTLYVHKTQFYGSERFPFAVDVSFGYLGNNSIVNLQRDDETTAMLTEELFEVSKILPTGVFSEDRKQDFAAYLTPESDVLIIHRETDDASPNFYGRLRVNNEKMVVHTLDGSHRIRREDEDSTRIKRATPGVDDIIETFVFADLSIFEHFRDEVMPGSTNREIKLEVKKYLLGQIKEVDSIFLKLQDYTQKTSFRVYFQQYQVITASNQQPWIADPIVPLNEQTISDLSAYYVKLQTKFAFPVTDFIVQMTRYSTESEEGVLAGSMCGSAPPIAILPIDKLPVTLAQVIALSMGVPLDAATACGDSSQFIMSLIYGPVSDDSLQGNRWLFSPCSASYFDNNVIDVKDLSCLRVQDIIFDFANFESQPYLGEYLSKDEQCVIRDGSTSTFCSINPLLDPDVDCYSQSQGCLKDGVCTQYTVAQRTPCDTGNNADFVCQFGFCLSSSEANATSTTSTSSTSSTTSSTSSTTSSTSSTTSSTSSTTSSTSSTTSSTSSTTSSTSSTTSSTDSTTTSTATSATSSTSSTTSSTDSTTTSTATTATSSTDSTTSSTATTSSVGTTTTAKNGKLTTTEPPDSTITTTTEETTTQERKTTTTPSCVIETGFVEVDLPGCGCCGGCGCDDTCSGCDPGVPGYTQQGECTKTPGCCNSKLRISTVFVPDDCDVDYIPGPRTVIVEKTGWINEDLAVEAEVYKDRMDEWQVQLIPKTY